jgi:hypothetical protein
MGSSTAPIIKRYVKLRGQRMAIDRKYGRVTLEHGHIGEDEPVVVFRATDKLLPKVLAYYRLFCWKAGSPRRHLELIDDSLQAVEGWQQQNPAKTPDSEASREWLRR